MAGLITALFCTAQLSKKKKSPKNHKTTKQTSPFTLRPKPMDHLAWLNFPSLPALGGWFWKNKGEESMNLRLWYAGNNVWKTSWDEPWCLGSRWPFQAGFLPVLPNITTPQLDFTPTQSARPSHSYSVCGALVRHGLSPDTCPGTEGCAPKGGDCRVLLSQTVINI